ncbi:M23 family metallopeptidase [Longimicrobium terrae]|nr:M23 family metallopeptidase [Longimicrobium terrae]
MAAGWAVPELFGRVNVALGWAPAPAVAPHAPPLIAAAPPIVPPPAVVAPAAPAVPPAAAPPVAALEAEPLAPAAVASTARLLIPVQGVKAADLVNTYDQSRGQGRRHDAIDIMAPRGTPVVAAADGVVMKRFQSERGGITLYQLAPDQRTIYYYAHLDRYAPRMVEGRALRRGDVLGYVGNTGDAGPGNYHLHFEVSTTADPRKYWGGVNQNPYPLLR